MGMQDPVRPRSILIPSSDGSQKSLLDFTLKWPPQWVEAPFPRRKGTSADCRPPFWGSMTRPRGYFGDVSRNFQTQTKPSAAIWRLPQWRHPFSSERRKGDSATERGSTTRTSETCRSLNLEWNEVALELRAADLWQLGLSAWPLLRGVLIAFCPLHLNETMQRKRGEETPLSWVWGRIPNCQTSPAFRSGLFAADEIQFWSSRCLAIQVAVFWFSLRTLS